MRAYGYSRSSDTDTPDVLSEATLLCTKEELDQIISFLQDIQRKCQSHDNVNGFHAHYRDFSSRWNPSESDFIICLTEDGT